MTEARERMKFELFVIIDDDEVDKFEDEISLFAPPTPAPANPNCVALFSCSKCNDCASLSAGPLLLLLYLLCDDDDDREIILLSISETQF